MIAGDGQHWRRRLRAIVSHPRRAEVERYIDTKVKAAFEAFAAELKDPEMTPRVEKLDDGMRLAVDHGENDAPFIYEVRTVSQPIPPFALTDSARKDTDRSRYYRAEVFLAQGSRGYDIYGSDEQQVIADVVGHYDRYRHYLALTN